MHLVALIFITDALINTETQWLTEQLAMAASAVYSSKIYALCEHYADKTSAVHFAMIYIYLLSAIY